MTGNEFPAWLVALVSLVSGLTLLSVRPMPLFIRVALLSPRLAIFALYTLYALFDLDMANRAFVTRLLLVILFLAESATAVIVRLEWFKLRKLGRRL